MHDYDYTKYLKYDYDYSKICNQLQSITIVIDPNPDIPYFPIDAHYLIQAHPPFL